MSHLVCWTKTIVEEFVKEALLSKEEEAVLRTRAAGWSRTEQIMKLDFLCGSYSKLDSMISTLKKKYKAASRYNPLLPPIKKSKEEEYMDTH